MAQLRQDYAKYVARDVQVIVVGPEDARVFAYFWQAASLPFIGLPDPEATVLRLYGRETDLFRLGREPAQMLVDKAGIARYVHYGHSISDIPENDEILTLVNEISAQTDPGAQRLSPGPVSRPARLPVRSGNLRTLTTSGSSGATRR